MTPDSFLELAKVLGVPLTVTLFLLWSGSRGMWVFGWVYKELRDDRDAWRSQAEHGTDLAETAVQPPRVRPRPRAPRA